MVAIQPLVSEFNLVGRLEDLLVDSKGRVRCLYLSTPEADYSIRVAKEQKIVLGEYLKPGCYLKVSGMRKYKLHKEEVKYKAYRIELLPEQSIPKHQTIATTKSKAKILICQGSSCCQKGGKAAYELLQTELQAQDLAKEAKIIPTGCLKQCKQAPNLIMPGGSRYSRVKPQEVAQLIKKHFN